MCEVATRLGLSPRTLERFRVTGEGSAFCKLGRNVRYSLADSERWLRVRARKRTSLAKCTSDSR